MVSLDANAKPVISSPPSAALALEPLERLHVTDGLLLTAERWKLAHNYHRQRQNVHYQALYQPGIVSGLTVSVIPAPVQFASQYRDQRWLRIHPGIAIDSIGNPIIVPEAIDYRIASEAPLQGTATVYLVLRYVDPDRLQRSEESVTEIVQETFRIDEKISSPNVSEIELCRILIQPGTIQLSHPPDVFSPGINQLDLRYRQSVRYRSFDTVQIGQLKPQSNEEVKVADQFSNLTRSLPHLHSELNASLIEIPALDDTDLLNRCHLLYLAENRLSQLTDRELEALKQFGDQGGVLLCHVSEPGSSLRELHSVHIEIQQALLNLPDGLASQELEAELEHLNDSINEQINQLALPMQTLAQQIGLLWHGSGILDRHHPLRQTPFAFSQFPIVGQTPTYLRNWGGIVLLIGDLIHAWGINDTRSFPRETIRTAQELGINLLYFAWKRKQMTSHLPLS
jgi:hypothetical protein